MARLREAELEAWGGAVGRGVATPVFLALRGPLGAGKSVLARAVARGAGVTARMPSPTFNLVFRYRGERAEVVHLDLYRLGDPDEVWELGWSELGGDDDLVLVEWAGRAGPHLPRDRWEVELSIPEPGRPVREVSVERRGDPPSLPVEPARYARSES